METKSPCESQLRFVSHKVECDGGLDVSMDSKVNKDADYPAFFIHMPTTMCFAEYGDTRCRCSRPCFRKTRSLQAEVDSDVESCYCSTLIRVSHMAIYDPSIVIVNCFDFEFFKFDQCKACYSARPRDSASLYQTCSIRFHGHVTLSMRMFWLLCSKAEPLRSTNYLFDL